MPTAVVSGRVDEDVYRRANVVIRREGTTPGEVIKVVWASIASTGRLPLTPEEENRRLRQRKSFDRLMELVQSLPPAPSELVNMTDDDMRRLFGGRDV